MEPWCAGCLEGIFESTTIDICRSMGVRRPCGGNLRHHMERRNEFEGFAVLQSRSVVVGKVQNQGLLTCEDLDPGLLCTKNCNLRSRDICMMRVDEREETFDGGFVEHGGCQRFLETSGISMMRRWSYGGVVQVIASCSLTTVGTRPKIGLPAKFSEVSPELVSLLMPEQNTFERHFRIDLP